MKCRLYPNKEQSQNIDTAIYAVQCYHNCIIWDMFENHVNTIEKTSKKNPEELIHFPDINKAMEAAYKNALIEQHPVINMCPQAAITTNIGLKADLKRELGKLPVEFQEPNYYTKSRPRRSYTYQETWGKIGVRNNKKVFSINLSKIGEVKVRGWNQKIRFTESGEVNFLEYAQSNPKAKVTVTIMKDNCGDYYICFKLQNVYKQMDETLNAQVGIDVGVRNLVIQSDGKKFPNMRYKENVADYKAALNRKMSRQQGWANIHFRKEREKNPELQVSKGYKGTKLKLAKLDRKVARKRKWWNNQVTTQIVKAHSFIAVETLSVKEMFQNKYLADSLSDAAMSQVLTMLTYKALWYERKLVAVNQWFASTQTCNDCAYQNIALKDSLPKEWTCPNCGARHDIDINAAKNLLDYALKQQRGVKEVENITLKVAGSTPPCAKPKQTQ